MIKKDKLKDSLIIKKLEMIEKYEDESFILLDSIIENYRTKFNNLGLQIKACKSYLDLLENKQSKIRLKESLYYNYAIVIEIFEINETIESSLQKERLADPFIELSHKNKKKYLIRIDNGLDEAKKRPCFIIG